MAEDAPSWLTENDNPFADNSVTEAASSAPTPAAAPAPIQTAIEPNVADDTPAWLQQSQPDVESNPSLGGTVTEQAGAPNAQVTEVQNHIAGAATAVTAQVAENAVRGEIEKHTLDPSKELGPMPKAWIVMRVCNVLVTMMVAGAVINKLQHIDFFEAFNVGILSLFIFGFATLLCCFESFGNWKLCAESLSSNFGFLYSIQGRLSFMFMTALLTISLSTNFAYIACGVVILNSLYNAYCMWQFPDWTNKIGELHRQYCVQNGC